MKLTPSTHDFTAVYIVHGVVLNDPAHHIYTRKDGHFIDEWSLYSFERAQKLGLTLAMEYDVPCQSILFAKDMPE